MSTTDDVLWHVERAVERLRKGRLRGNDIHIVAYVARKVDLACALSAANRTNHPEKGRVLRLMDWCRAAERAGERRAA